MTAGTEPLLLRILFIVVVAYVAIAAIRAYRAGSRSRKQADPGPGEGEELVLDPQCRSYVTKRAAILQAGNYFCSRECAKLFLSR